MVMKRILIAIAALPLVVMVGGMWALHAQTIGCSNKIFGSLHLITEANAQAIFGPCATSTPVVPCNQTGLDFTNSCNAILYVVLF
jgi:hypothetical protein